MRVASLSGPVTTGPMLRPVSPLPVDLAAAGYVEEEFFAAGSATAWQAVGDGGPDGRWQVAPAEEAPYRTRVVVRRPVDESRFSGIVVVEWLNVSGGVEAAADWAYLHEEILRRGHGYAAVSVQAFGIDGGTPLLEVPGAPAPGGLVGAGPERYGGLAHPGDRFAFDIYSQVGRALHGAGDPAPLGPLLPTALLAVGESQSAFFLTTYLDAVHHDAEVYDGCLVHSRGGGAASLAGEPMSDAVPRGLRIRDDVRIPVLILETETDLGPLLDFGPARQPDSARVRTWEVAGTAHADAYLVGPFAAHLGCGHPINDGPHHFVAQAALRALERWVTDATPPPAGAPLALASTAPPVLARDAGGNALGGVRTPDVEVPVAALSGEAPEGASVLCALFGSTTPYDGATLRTRYGDEGGYRSAHAQALDSAVAARFLLEDDRPALVARAEAVRFPD